MKKKNLWLPLFLILIGSLFVVNIPTYISIISSGKYSNVAEFIATVNTSLPNEFNGKYIFINLNGLIQGALGSKSLNDVVKLNNGYLTITDEKADTTIPAQLTKNFAEDLKAEGVEFLYVQTPYIVDEENSTLPVGVKDYANENATEYLNILETEGVPYLDLRDDMKNMISDHYDMFFHTDHHWKPEAAFYGYVCLQDRLEELLNVNVDDSFKDIENYEKETYEDIFLGSNGKRTGIYYAGVDDLCVLTPKDSAVNYSFCAPYEDVYRNGDFKDALMDYSHLEQKDYFGINCYHVYIGEEYALTHITNPDAPIDKKILIIKDSFVLPVQAFMAQCYSSLDTIDLRLYSENTVMEYVKETRPDVVIVFYNPHMLIAENMFYFE